MPDASEERRDVPGPVLAGRDRRPPRSSLLVGAVGLAVVVAGVALGLTLARSERGARQASCAPTAPKLSVVGTGQASVSPDLLTVVVQVDAGGPSAATALATATGTRLLGFNSNNSNSTDVAFREKTEKFTPLASGTAPSGWGRPGAISYRGLLMVVALLESYVQGTCEMVTNNS